VFNKVQSVAPLDNCCILVRFKNGEAWLYDVGKLIAGYDAFGVLSDVPELFALVKADPGGYGVSWNDDIDISCEELYFNGMVIARDDLNAIAAK
jgi:hypothetical protein